jgi:hypothetical protein
MSEEIDFDLPGPIGIQDIEVEQSFTKINTNRTLVVASLHESGPFDPKIVPDASSLGKLFEYATPSVEVQLETGDEDHPTEDILVTYDSLKAFRPAELEKTIGVLQKQKAQEISYQKIKAELERSKKLQEIMTDEEKRTAFLAILKSVEEELEANND